MPYLLALLVRLACVGIQLIDVVEAVFLAGTHPSLSCRPDAAAMVMVNAIEAQVALHFLTNAVELGLIPLTCLQSIPRYTFRMALLVEGIVLPQQLVFAASWRPLSVRRSCCGFRRASSRFLVCFADY